MIVGRHQVMLECDRLTVAHPVGDDMPRESVLKLGLPARSHRVKEASPRLHLGSAKDTLKLSPQVGVLLAVSADDEDGSLGGDFPSVFEDRRSSAESGMIRYGFPCRLSSYSRS